MPQEPFWWAGFWQELVRQVLQGIAIFGAGVSAALLSFKLLSKRWEQTKLSSELTVDLMTRFWARLDVLSGRLSTALSANLRNKDPDTKKDAFINLLDFRITLSRFYEDASGWLPGLDQALESRTLTLQDAIYTDTVHVVPRHAISKIMDQMTPREKSTVPYYRLFESIDEKDSMIRPLFEKFEKWISKSDGKDVEATGKRFAEYTGVLKRLIKTVFPMY